MERLTYKSGHGQPVILIDGRERGGTVAERLAAYEDTGLDPESIELLAKMNELLTALGITAMELTVLLLARMEGRLQIRPRPDNRPQNAARAPRIPWEAD